MSSQTEVPSRRTEDDRVFLHGVSWADFERIVAIRGEGRGVRLTYLEGELELMGPSKYHEYIKKCIARLVEAWADEHRVPLQGIGSWLIKNEERECAAEPDECYVVGVVDLKKLERPDFAIEVIWTHGGIDKLEVYRGLDVREVWMWEDERISVYSLRRARYSRIDRSEVLPELDLDQLVKFVDPNDQSGAVSRYREVIRRRQAR